MNHLWAPWRVKYITQPHTKGCFICQARKSKNDSTNLVLARYPKTLVVTNRFPYNTGHLLIAPLRHEGKIAKLSQSEMLELFTVLQAMQQLLTKVMKPDGFNVGINLGRVAGAGLVGHFHIHIVPRWNGDTNFMPVITHTKVISQSLDALYAKLRSHLR